MSKNLRTLVRLLSLREYDLIPDDGWDEYSSLKTLVDTGREKWEKWAGILAQIVIRHGVTTLDEKVVRNLVFAVGPTTSSSESTKPGGTLKIDGCNDFRRRCGLYYDRC
jgi:hypothetical protein